MQAGPYYPTLDRPTTYAMAGDDCALHFDLDKLTPKQQADHTSNIELTAMLQVALLYIGKSDDHLALYREFQDAPWAEVLDFHRRAFARLGIESIPESHWHFHPAHGFYESLADAGVTTDRTTLYMTSGSNRVLHRDATALGVSQMVNSKFHFAEQAPRFGLPVPETLVTTHDQVASRRTVDFMTRVGTPCMLKTLGLAGARNVTTVSSTADALAWLAEYDADMPVLLQQRLSSERYTEMTVDLLVSDTEIRIANMRRILFADGLWVGNLLGGNVSLRPAHEAVLLRVGEYAREHGHTAPDGFNCGVDFFVRADELIVTEINARWTGGLFPAQMIERLNAGHRNAVAFFDLVRVAQIDDYLAFADRHLPDRAHDDAFSAVPLGFSPFPTEVDGEPTIYVWQLVLDDFGAFLRAKNSALGAGMLPTADLIDPGIKPG